jgi:histidinol dehydrogenase
MINWQQLSPYQQTELLNRPAIAESESLSAQVASIVSLVKAQGDKALFELTEKFDGISLSSLKLSEQAIAQAKARIAPNRVKALNTAYQQIEIFHAAQKPQDINVETRPGVNCTLKTESIESVGLYIPAGSAPLPSTVLMLGVPAQLAGCQRTVLVCPPDKNGELADEVIIAADLCGIDEVYLLGGAQAVAALALGTETIKPVNKVFGPGNKYVTEAKKQLSQQVPGFTIDMPAGPSELLIIADSSASPVFVAADLLSQAEHGIDSQVILLSDSEALISATEQELEKQLATLPRAEIAREALKQSRLIKVENLEQACQVSNLYGPEHLSIQTQDSDALLNQLRNAGSIFVGHYSPEAAGDYASGTNHVLPTYGYSKVLSSLSLADFSRRYTVQKLSKDGLASLAETLVELTDAEGLIAHQRAVTLRLADTLEAGNG